MIKSVQLNQFRNSEFIQFISNFLEVLEEKDLPALNLQSHTDSLKSLHSSMVALYQPDRGSDITKQIQQEDERRDAAISGIQMLIEAYTNHFDAVKRKAAESLDTSLKKYGNRIGKQNYQAETAIINSILDEWQNQANLLQAQSILGINDWVLDLADANTKVNTNYLLRAKEDAESPDIKIADLRKKIISAYRDLGKRIEAFATISDEEAYIIIMKQSNSIIEKYNAMLAARSAKEIDASE